MGGEAGQQGKNKRTKSTPVPRFRESLSVGTVVILVAGPYKGKRVVIVKQLDSGNIAVTGPYAVNGVPLRRVNPRFVVATSTKLPTAELDTTGVNDAFFNKTKLKCRSKKSESEDVFMGQADQSVERILPEKKVEMQKKVDKILTKFLENPENALLKQYLKTRFTLRDRMYPHALKF